MNLLVFLVSLTLTAGAKDQDPKSQWENFKKTYNKSYENELDEKSHYYSFLYNLEKIKEHNKKYEKGLVSYKQKITKFSDIHPKYFSGQFKIKGPLADDDQQNPTNFSSKATFRAYGQQPQIPESIDWRRLGKVSKVRDQGGCESCWAFSVAESVESQLLINNRQALLSPQQLVDCSSTFGNLGCNGGWAHKALNYIKANGLEQEMDYPYTATYNRCQYNRQRVVTYISDYKTGRNEESLKEFVGTRGPAAVFINADTLQHYGGGVFDGDNCSNSPSDLNHVLLVVGYGQKADGTQYWIIKNSWGTTWGENGYMRLLRNGQYVCGVGLWSYVPIL